MARVGFRAWTPRRLTAGLID